VTPAKQPRTLGSLALRIPFAELAVSNAFRLEDSLKHWRMRRARRRGEVEQVEAYTGYGSTSQVRVLGRVQMVPEAVRRYGLRKFSILNLPRGKERSVRGWRSFVRVAVPNSTVRVRIGDRRFEVKADRGGILDATFDIALEPGWHEIEFATIDDQYSTSQVFITPDDQQIGIISDIDDTVMVTSLPRPLLAAWNTFVLDEHARMSVPGMNVLYQRLVDKFGADTTPFFYLSTGSWNVAPTLSRFLGRNLFPFGPLLLTDWGPTTKRLFRSGTEHKRTSLRALAEQFPDVKWILIGDDGQHDESIYGEFATTHPGHVAAVVIRQLSNTESVLAGGRAGSSARWRQRVRVPWVHGPSGATLVEELAKYGIIDHDPQAADLVDLSKSLADKRVARPLIRRPEDEL
jgi:phosphatidate phosphatase APP1